MATGSLETKEAVCTVVWKIPNFKSIGKPLDQRPIINSPEFFSGGAGGGRWRLGCYPFGDTLESDGWVSVHLVNVTDNVQKASYSLELCLPDGGVKSIGCVEERLFFKSTDNGFSKGVERADAWNNTINGDLVLRATVITKVPEDRDIPILISDVRKLLTSGEFADFEIKAGSRLFKVHKNLLSTRCGYFSAMLKMPMRETENGTLVVTAYNEQTIEELISYLYTGKLTNHGVAEELASVAEEYCLPELKKLCSYSLKETLSVENVCRRISIAELLSMAELKESCLRFMVENWKDVVDSPEFKILITKKLSLAMEVIQREAKR